jgi:Fe-S-cluster containining protein
MATWRCVAQCGACCHLDPVDRPDLDQYLSSSELELYLSLVGEDGWCVHYDSTNRKCQIYEERPRFCRVTLEVFRDLYGVEPKEFNDFAVDCCHQQIDGVYGDNSQERNRFEQTVG